MTEQPGNPTENAKSPDRESRRKNRGIRFTDAEWSLIEAEAEKRKVTPSQLARQAALAFVSGEFPEDFGAEAAALPPGIQTQIEKIYRGVYFLATLKRKELLGDGRQEELNTLRKEASSTQQAIVKNASRS